MTPTSLVRKATKIFNRYISEKTEINGYLFIGNAKTALSNELPTYVEAELSADAVYMELKGMKIEGMKSPVYLIYDSMMSMIILVDGDKKGWIFNGQQLKTNAELTLKDVLDALPSVSQLINLGFNKIGVL